MCKFCDKPIEKYIYDEEMGKHMIICPFCGSKLIYVEDKDKYRDEFLKALDFEICARVDTFLYGKYARFTEREKIATRANTYFSELEMNKLTNMVLEKIAKSHPDVEFNNILEDSSKEINKIKSLFVKDDLDSIFDDVMKKMNKRYDLEEVE